MNNLTPVNNEGKIYSKIPEFKDLDNEPSSLGVGSDKNELQKTAEKFLLENVPKALKMTAKNLMIITTVVPAFALDKGGKILKNVGFFIRAAPMALGGVIGEKLAPSKDDVYHAKLIGRLAGLALAAPITIPAIAIELMGRVAHFAGHLHIKGNITEEIDLGIYLKHHFANQSPADLKKEYAYELLKKNPSISIKEINDKFAIKFRNQKEFKDITFDESDLKQYQESIIGSLMDQRKGTVDKLKKELNNDKNINNYIRGIENEVQRQCQSVKLSPELKSEILNRAKAEAIYYVSTQFKIYATSAELRDKCQEFNLPEAYIRNVLKAAGFPEPRVEKALKNLDAHVNKMVKTLKNPDVKLGAIKAFLENDSKGKFLLRNEERKEFLIAHLLKQGLSQEEIDLIFKSKKS